MTLVCFVADVDEDAGQVVNAGPEKFAADLSKGLVMHLNDTKHSDIQDNDTRHSNIIKHSP